MAPLENLITLEPADELVFLGPFKHQVRKCLKITNPHVKQSILFKIRTTSPKLYCVRPNVGQLGPEETVNVEICLLPFNFDGDSSASKRHKFLIQAAHSPPNVENVAEFWKYVDPADVCDTKIRCALISNDNANKEAPLVADEDDELAANLQTRRLELESAGAAKPKQRLEKVNLVCEEISNGPSNQRSRKLKAKKSIYFYGTFLAVVAVIVAIFFTKYVSPDFFN